MSDQERSFRLYYDTGSGYNEKESVAGEVLRRDKQSTTYHFQIPHDKTLIAVRIDPDEQPARYLIKTISTNYIADSKRVYPHLTWNAEQIEKLFVPLHNVKPFVLQQGNLLVETEGPDPYFGTKENLSETWKKLRSEQHPLLLPLKIGGYLLLVLMAMLFVYRYVVLAWLKKAIHLLSSGVIFGLNEISHAWSKVAILGFIMLFAISAYFVLADNELSIGAYYLIFYWIYLAGVFFMAGWITQRLLNFVCRDLFKDINLSQCCVLGIVFITIVAMLIHFVLPLNSTLHMVVILSLCSFCVLDKKNILNYCVDKLNRARALHQCCSTTHILLTVIACTIFILVVFRALYLSIGGPTEYDTLLYHAQIVKWLKEYSIVPGLGNLHHRLAYNSSFHVLASFLDVGVFQDKSFHGLNSFFFLFLEAYLLIRVWFLCLGDVRIANIFAALFILLEPFLIPDSFFGKMNSLSTDFVTLVFVGYIILYFIELLQKEKIPTRGDLIVGLSITGFASTVKLVSAPLLLLPIFVLAKYWKTGRLKWTSPPGIIKRNSRFILIVSFIIVTLFTPWVTRNVILSGYIVYPVYQVDIFNPEWKMPKSLVIDDSRWIQSWARVPNVYPDKVLDHGFLHWLKLWVHKQSVIPLGVVLGFHLLILLLFLSYYRNAFSMLLRVSPLSRQKSGRYSVHGVGLPGF
jgi:hypothetical protein